MQFTRQQQDIINYIDNGGKNLLITARAGCAKTTTIEHAINKSEGKTLYLAFNKAIVAEAKAKGIKSDIKTLNGIGYLTTLRYFRAVKPKLDPSKTFNLLKGRAKKNFNEIFNTVNLAKSYGYLPPSDYLIKPKSIISRELFYQSIPYQFEHSTMDFIDKVLIKSFKLIFEGTIDFQDQILAPALLPMPFPEYETVFVDEAQDLSLLDQRFLSKIVGNNRLIAVGDDMQAIYGFRGADTNAMNSLKTHFNMEELKLTTTFRCAWSIVDHAKFFVPELKPFIDATQGQVTNLNEIELDDFLKTDAVLCRNNFPLLKVALKLLRRNKPFSITNDGFLKSFNSILKKMEEKDFETAIQEWSVHAKKVNKNREKVDEIENTLRMLAKEVKTVKAASAYLRQIIQKKGSPLLSTVHKAKGREWDTVTILDDYLFDYTKNPQDFNLEYVATTRARFNLFYVDSRKIIFR